MVLCGQSFTQVIGKDKPCVIYRLFETFRPFQQTYAPVVVGRKAKVQVVKFLSGQIRSYIKRLVANQHAVSELFPGQLFRCLQTAVADEASLSVHPIRFAVEDGGREAFMSIWPKTCCKVSGLCNRSPAFRKTI